MIINNYEEQVYAGVLGKVIGVYMGRPFEGWPKERLVEQWGLVDRYVHEDRGVPLVVADDDITGTFTFPRTLRDTGLYADTPVERFGDSWLNYIVPFKSILWWGGMGYSTEHTAFLRLANGYKAPESGSIALNGRTVAEQIGAQIFIDAFGLIAPGRPELAAELARKAGSVSHDGEAVHGAVVVACMVSTAFVEKDMDTILDTAIGFVPKECLIAAVHRDVRAWCREDGDWQKTYERIKEKYGYSVYGGGCHMIPNHAIMVMAWCYAPDDFRQAQAIINTAGWDTDCNAANVGSVMGVKVGLEGINRSYDFQGPMADRMVLPTAEGTRSVTDCLNEALEIAAMGRRTMGWDEVPRPRDGAMHHFSLPGALHGYMSEDEAFDSRGAARVSNVENGKDSRGMLIEATGLCAGRPARVSTPVLCRPRKGGYTVMGTPRLCSGMSVTLEGSVKSVEGSVEAALYVRYGNAETKSFDSVAHGKRVALKAGKPLSLSLAVPDTRGWPVSDVGIEITGENRARADVLVDKVSFSGGPDISIPAPLPTDQDGNILGWIIDTNKTRNNVGYRFPDAQVLNKDQGRGHLVTGTLDWKDYTFETDFFVHCGDAAGILVRYQGLRRYVALAYRKGKLQLLRVCYEEKVLGETDAAWEVDELHKLTLVARGDSITAHVDGKKVLECSEKELSFGGVGYLVENGSAGFRNLKVSATAHKRGA